MKQTREVNKGKSKSNRKHTTRYVRVNGLGKKAKKRKERKGERRGREEIIMKQTR